MSVLISQVPQPGRSSGAVDRIHAFLPHLSPAERRVGEAVIASPADAIGMSIMEFAERCGVAQATLTRFAQHVGFDGYPALRLSLANDRALAATDGGAGAAAEDLQAAAAFAADDYLPMVGAELRHASTVEIWTEPDTSPGAELLAAELRSLGVLAAWSGKPRHWLMSAPSLPPKAVVVVLSGSSGLHGDAAHALEIARQRGATSVVIGTAMSTDALEGAKYVLPLPQGATPELSSVVAAHTVAQAVRAVSHLVIDGPASPWVPWPHVRDVHIPFEGHDPIPATLLSQPPDRPSRSLVVLLGGHRASRSQALPPGVLENRELPSHTAALLNAGHHVLVVENPGHGARIREWEEPSSYIGSSIDGRGEDVLELAWSQAPSVVDAILALPEDIDPRRIAVVGQSWGGLQAMLLASGDRRIACVAALMPICFPTTVREYRRFRDRPRVAATSLLGPRGAELASRPLLLVSGELDHVAPAKQVRRLEEGLRPRYEEQRRGDDLVHVQLANVGHTFSRDATELMVQWVARHTEAVSIVRLPDGGSTP